MSAADELRDAVAAELAALTANGGPAGTKSPRATYEQFADDPNRARVRKEIITDYPVSYTHLTLPTNREV